MLYDAVRIHARFKECSCCTLCIRRNHLPHPRDRRCRHVQRRVELTPIAIQRQRRQRKVRMIEIGLVFGRLAEAAYAIVAAGEKVRLKIVQLREIGREQLVDQRCR